MSFTSVEDKSSFVSDLMGDAIECLKRFGNNDGSEFFERWGADLGDFGADLNKEVEIIVSIRRESGSVFQE